MKRSIAVHRVAIAILVLASAAFVAVPARRASALPAGVEEDVAFSRLPDRTFLKVAPDRRIFAAEMLGVFNVFDSLNDTTPTVFADLRTEVHDFWDRGLLGMALPTNFPQSPH